MNVIQIGPFALDAFLLISAAGIAAALIWIIYRDKKAAPRVEPVFWYLLLFSLLAGRLGFVLRFWSAYQPHPVHILNIRDGGFDWRIALGTYLFLLLLILWWRRQAFYRLVQSSLLVALVIGLGIAGLQLGSEEKANWFELGHLDELIPHDGAPGTRVLAHLDDYAGQPMVINLWASWCPPCRREMPVLQAAQQQNQEVHFLFINQWESPDDIQQFIVEQGLQLEHVWLDPLSLSGPAIGSKGLPSTLFVDEKGRIQSTRLGELSAATLQSHLESIRNN